MRLFSFLGLLASPTKKGLRKHGREISSSTLFELRFVAAKKKRLRNFWRTKGGRKEVEEIKKKMRERERERESTTLRVSDNFRKETAQGVEPFLLQFRARVCFILRPV